MSQLNKTLQPEQFMYVMKHSLCPLVQLSIPPHLCSPAELKFDKLRLTEAERKEEHAMNMMLPRPYHPSLASLPPKHATHALAAIIHAVLCKHIFNSKESLNTICEQFQIAPKKLYEGMMGKHYDPGVKLMKAEKQRKEAEANIKKLKMPATKEDTSKESTSTTTTTHEMDTSEMPRLISSKEEDQQPRGAKKKWFVNRKLTPKPSHMK